MSAHFSNVARPVFALITLAEAVKGALCARCPRHPGTLRRMFLEDFPQDLSFSSRRRQTILQGDWSSDVCSSDLRSGAAPELLHGRGKHVAGPPRPTPLQIGRASGRGRGYMPAGAPSLKKKNN